MQLSNLNKTINLFLVGTVVICNFVVLQYFVIKSDKLSVLFNFIAEKKLNEGVLGALALGPILFIGIILDTVTDALRSFARRRKIAGFLKKKLLKFRIFQRDIDIYEKWLRETKKAITPDYDEKYATKEGVAITIFFENASSSSISWVISHFVSYMLAANFLVISIVDFAMLLCYGEFLYSGLFLLISFILLIQVIEKYFYTYGFLFRYTALKLAKYKYLSARSNADGSAGGGESELELD